MWKSTIGTIRSYHGIRINVNKWSSKIYNASKSNNNGSCKSVYKYYHQELIKDVNSQNLFHPLISMVTTGGHVSEFIDKFSIIMIKLFKQGNRDRIILKSSPENKKY